MTGPWIKLWRDILTRKIGFLMRRYGHEVLTFWVGVLTNSEEGILEIDEDMLADICLLETKRYEEIRSIFIARGLIEVDEDGRIFVLNWEEYQGGGGDSSSTERVRRLRDRRRAPIHPVPQASETDAFAGPTNETDETLHETGETLHETLHETGETLHETGETLHETEELEEEGEEEGEEERGRPREETSLFINPLSPGPGDSLGPHQGIAFAWFKRYSKETAILIGPSSEDLRKAKDLFDRLGGDERTILRAVDDYFTRWRELWWVVKKSTRSKPEDEKIPDFSFFSFVSHITELISGLSPPQSGAITHAPAAIVCPVCSESNPGSINMATCGRCHFDLSERENPIAIQDHEKWFLAYIKGEIVTPKPGELMSRVRGEKQAS